MTKVIAYPASDIDKIIKLDCVNHFKIINYLINLKPSKCFKRKKNWTSVTDGFVLFQSQPTG